MKEKLLIEIPIPMDWTGDQAKAVWEFFGTLAAAVWDTHEEEIIEVFEDEILEAEMKQKCKINYPKSKDDIPF